jgi:drug/metabolite transporter (DMT)-like permease
MTQPNAKPSIPPRVVIGVGILAASSASIIIRLAQVYVPSLVIVAFRLTLATLILAPFALTRHRHEIQAISRQKWILVITSGLFLALHFISWTTSLEYTDVVSSVMLVSTVPVWVALLSPLVLHESVSRYAIFGMGLAIFGGFIITISDACRIGAGGINCNFYSNSMGNRALLGDLLALIGAVMAAGYVMIGRKLRRSMELVSYVFVVYGIAALALIILVIISGNTFLGYPIAAYGWLVLLALVPQLIGHTSFNWALRYLSAGFVSISLLGEPIGSAILAYIFLAEAPTFGNIFGAILILFGIYMASISKQKKLASINSMT